jgi:hypothetical protein
MAWGAKGIRGRPLSILRTFYKQRVSMVLQHAIFILKCVVAVGEGSSKLCVLSGSPPFSLLDIFFATRKGWRT